MFVYYADNAGFTMLDMDVDWTPGFKKILANMFAPVESIDDT